MTAIPSDNASSPRIPPGLVLAAAIVGISTAAPLVRVSASHPVVIAFWRLGFSLAIVVVALALSGEWRELRRIGGARATLAVAAGVLLAAHFWAWNASVQLTTIAASVTLVSLQPIVVAALSAVFLRERPTARQLLGIAIAVVGALLITAPGLFAGAGPGGRPGAALGNLLALSGAAFAAVYYVLGRHLRAGLGLWTYVAIVYSTCFVALGAAALALGLPFGPQPPRELAIFAALAIGPMLLGHTGMNWALKYRPAYVVNLTVLAEPVGASLLAAMLPWIAEVPPVTTMIGGAVVLAGILLAAGTKQAPGTRYQAPEKE